MKLAANRLDGVFAARQRIDRVAALLLADDHEGESAVSIMHFHECTGHWRDFAVLNNSLQRAGAVLRVNRLRAKDRKSNANKRTEGVLREETPSVATERKD